MFFSRREVADNADNNIGLGIRTPFLELPYRMYSDALVALVISQYGAVTCACIPLLFHMDLLVSVLLEYFGNIIEAICSISSH